MNAKAKEILDKVVVSLSSETASKFVRDRLFADGSDIPCRRWSVLNQFSVSLAGTADARGIRQWNTVGRRVNMGAKALYILIPILVPNPNQIDRRKSKRSDENGNSKSLLMLRGFKVMPVFRVEDTEGTSLDYQLAMRAFDVASLPLIEVATSLGVKVNAGLLPSSYSGSFNRRTKQIILGTDNPQTFLHELSHAIDSSLPNQRDDYAFCEIVAELSSCFLGSLFGVKTNIGSTKAYIESYAGKGHVAFRITEALGRVEEIYRYIEFSRESVVPHGGVYLGMPLNREYPYHLEHQELLSF
jgi:hypothetical protein